MNNLYEKVNNTVFVGTSTINLIIETSSTTSLKLTNFVCRVVSQEGFAVDLETDPIAVEAGVAQWVLCMPKFLSPASKSQWNKAPSMHSST